MAENFSLNPVKIQMLAAVQELQKCNRVSAKFGLMLSDTQIQSLVEQRFAALKDTGRVEFGGGIMAKLIYAFCDSPYITQENYTETLTELQDDFYYYKNESDDELTDDELIAFMVKMFNGKAQGSLEYLAETSLNDLCRKARWGSEFDEK